MADRILLDAGQTTAPPISFFSQPRSWLRSHFRSRVRSIGPIFIVGLVVAAVIIPWHITNQWVPYWDGANFVETALNIRDTFTHGLLSGLHALYFERGWRPIIFPNAVSPFFILFDGAIRPSVAASLYACALIVVIYVYLFLKSLTSTLGALVGAIFIATLAWFNGYASAVFVGDTTCEFYSEILWLAGTAGVIYHLTTALRSSAAWHYGLAGVWFGVMAAVRPVETVVIALLPVTALAFRQVISGAIRIPDLLTVSAQLILVCIVLALKTLSSSHDMIAACLLIAAICLIGIRARQIFFRSSFLGSLVAAELVAVGWHLPSMQKLYSWAYSTSFGPLVQITDQKFRGLSYLDAIGRLLSHYSPIVLAVLAACSLTAIVGLKRFEFMKRSLYPLGLVFCSILMAAPIVGIMIFSGTSNSRRIMPAVFVLYVGLVAISLQPARLISTARFAVVGILTAIQLTAILANELTATSLPFERLQTITGRLAPPQATPDGNRTILDELFKMGIQSGTVAVFTYCSIDPVDNCERYNVPWFEPLALRTLAQESHLPISIAYLPDADYADPNSVAKQMKANSLDYLLIDMLDKPMQTNHPIAVPTRQLIALEHGPLPPGLENRGCISLGRPVCLLKVVVK